MDIVTDSSLAKKGGGSKGTRYPPAVSRHLGSSTLSIVRITLAMSGVVSPVAAAPSRPKAMPFHSVSTLHEGKVHVRSVAKFDD
jgi:hypothetical protein